MVKPVEKETTRRAKLIEVIETVSTLGNGVSTPIREVIQYWSKDGKFLSEKDPCPEHNLDNKINKTTILQLAKELEHVLTNDLIDENTSVYEFINVYLYEHILK